MRLIEAKTVQVTSTPSSLLFNSIDYDFIVIEYCGKVGQSFQIDTDVNTFIFVLAINNLSTTLSKSFINAQPVELLVNADDGVATIYLWKYE